MRDEYGKDRALDTDKGKSAKETSMEMISSQIDMENSRNLEQTLALVSLIKTSFCKPNAILYPSIILFFPKVTSNLLTTFP